MGLAPSGEGHGAHRVPRDDRQLAAFDSSCLQNELKVRRECFERVVVVARSLGEPVAAVVVGDDAELVRKPLDLAVPELRGLDPAMDEDEGGEVVSAVDPRVAVAAVGAADVDGATRLRFGAPRLARRVGALGVLPCVQRNGTRQRRCDKCLVSGRLPHSGSVLRSALDDPHDEEDADHEERGHDERERRNQLAVVGKDGDRAVHAVTSGPILVRSERGRRRFLFLLSRLLDDHRKAVERPGDHHEQCEGDGRDDR